jgi:thermitase
MFKKILFLIIICGFNFQLKSQIADKKENNSLKMNSVLITTPNDPRFQAQWGLTKIQAPLAWDITTGDPNMIIGILDTGIPLVNGVVTHEDFDTNRIILGVDYLQDGYGVKDRHGHGTFLAGIIAAKTYNNVGIAGINWNSKLYINQISDDYYGDPYYDRIANGMINAVNNYAKVINCSFGLTDNNQSVRQAIEYARNNNCLIVVSGGNTGYGGVIR